MLSDFQITIPLSLEVSIMWSTECDYQKNEVKYAKRKYVLWKIVQRLVWS